MRVLSSPSAPKLPASPPDQVPHGGSSQGCNITWLRTHAHTPQWPRSFPAVGLSLSPWPGASPSAATSLHFPSAGTILSDLVWLRKPALASSLRGSVSSGGWSTDLGVPHPVWGLERRQLPPPLVRVQAPQDLGCPLPARVSPGCQDSRLQHIDGVGHVLRTDSSGPDCNPWVGTVRPCVKTVWF